MNNTASQNNPIASLLQQALSLTENTVGVPVIIDYEAIARAAIQVFLEREEKRLQNPRLVITQNEAHNLYGKNVIPALVRRNHLQQYKFDMREVYGLDGEVIRKAKGVIYYRVIDIERAIEKGNVLKGIREIRR